MLKNIEECDAQQLSKAHGKALAASHRSSYFFRHSLVPVACGLSGAYGLLVLFSSVDLKQCFFGIEGQKVYWPQSSLVPIKAAADLLVEACRKEGAATSHILLKFDLIKGKWWF